MTSPVRMMIRDAGIHEIADLTRSKQHWIIGTTPHTAKQIADQLPTIWNAVVYLDAGTDIILVGDKRVAQVTTAVGLDVCAIYAIPKKLVTARQLQKHFHHPIPTDGSQDILMFSEPIADDVAATYTPTIILEVAGLIDGKDYLQEFGAS